jgi:hypothetical protein
MNSKKSDFGRVFEAKLLRDGNTLIVTKTPDELDTENAAKAVNKAMKKNKDENYWLLNHIRETERKISNSIKSNNEENQTDENFKNKL